MPKLIWIAGLYTAIEGPPASMPDGDEDSFTDAERNLI
jgi:hypothetical protein